MNKPTLAEQETPSFDPIGAAKDRFCKESLPGLMEIAARDKPGIGCCVKVLRGKHAGKLGEVFWHGPAPHFYVHMSDMEDAMRQARGIYGFRVGVKTESEKFFVDAENVERVTA